MLTRLLRRSRRLRWLPQIVVFLAVTCLYTLGYLDFAESELADTRFELAGRAPSEHLLVVEIDARSLQELPVWPWPRRYHAEVVDRLIAAGARRVAIDVDFSARSSPEEDRALERALEASSGRVILPAFMQAASGDSGRTDMILSAPLPDLARHAVLASVNVAPEADGRVRSVAPVVAWGASSLPAMFTALAEPPGPVPDSFYIDYGIRLSAIERVSFVDIQTGRFDPALVAGRNVLIGATAGELGDNIPVPVHGVLPAVMVQALAYESLIAERILQRVTQAPILLVALLIVLLLGPRFLTWSWSRGLLLLATVWLAAFVLSAAVQALSAVVLEVTPWLLASALAYAYALTRRLDQQDLRLLTQSLAIRRKDALMSQVVENSLDGILTFDENGAIRTLNRAAADIFGERQETAIGRDLNKMLYRVLPGGTQLKATDLCRLEGGPHEFVARLADGERRAVQAVVSRMAQDRETLFIAQIRDVSRQKRAEREAREAQIRLNEAIESISEGFALYDERDRLVLCNGKFRECLFGPEQPVLSGLSFEEITRQAAERGRIAATAGRIEYWVAECLERHRNPQGPYEQRFEDGSCALISERKTRNGGTVAIYTDISEMKRQESGLRDAVEQAQMANRSKTEFLANMSHELRTPLNAIIGFSEMIFDEILGPLETRRYREYAEDIHGSGKHLLDIINDVLDVSKIEAGKRELDCAPIDIGRLTEASLLLVEQRALEAGHSLLVDLPDDLPSLYADKRALKQILINLLSNAVKFTPDGGVISVSARLAEDGRLVIDIADNGIGIAPEDVPKALAFFAQVESDLSRRFEGTGLGLALSRRLTELHGGTLELASEVGVGTTVTMAFPADRVRGPGRLTVVHDATRKPGRRRRATGRK
jgi:PAS domain S-box-containing protein